MPDPDDLDDRLPTHELKRRASAGLFVVASWGFVNLVFAFFGNLALARLLDPHSFGVVAVGSTVLLIVLAFAEGGIGNAFIRRPAPPSAAELRTLTGIQLGLTTIAAAIVAFISLPFGEAGRVTALMMFAMPASTFQSAGRIRLGRDLRLRQITLVEAGAITAYYAWSITSVALGAGVWGLATGAIVRAAAQSTTMAFIPGAGVYRPTLELWRQFGEVMRFGVRFQANWVVIVLRDQGINATTAVVSGVYNLGLWTLANRLLLLPLLLFESIGRVTFPTMAHILSAGRDARPLAERTARLAATASALLLAPFVAATPGLLPVLFGAQWADAADIFPGACLGLMVGGPVAAAGVGYLFAANRPSEVLRASIAFAVVWVLTTAALLQPFGVSAIGIGLAAGATAEALVLQFAVRRMMGAHIMAPLLVPLLVAVPAATCGWLLTRNRGDSLLAALQGGAAAGALTLIGLFALSRSATLDLLRVGGGSVFDALGIDRARLRRRDAT